MTNTSTKGTALELKAMRGLQAAGYLVHRTVRNPIFSPTKGYVGSHNNDVFGAFDLVATHPLLGMRFIQVTTVEHIPDHQRKVEAVAPMFPTTVNVEVWGWVGGARRLDQRFKDRRVFLRRQYFRLTVCWRGAQGLVWMDETPELDGWIDGQVAGVEDHRGQLPRVRRAPAQPTEGSMADEIVADILDHDQPWEP